MRKRFLVMACTTLTFSALIHERSRRAEAGGSEDTKRTFVIGDIGWLAGDWRSDHEGDVLQEIWSEPIGDTMMCSFRWMKNGKTWMYELVSVTQEANDVVLRLKHFNNRLVGWEEKDECLDLSLVRVTDHEAVFEHPTRRNLKRLIYTHPSDNMLVARVEGLEEDGSVSSFEIKFTRHKG